MLRVCGALVGTLALAAVVPPVASGQDAAWTGDGPAATELGRTGAARILEVEGPPLAGRREFYRPVPPLRIRHRWILVQDSTARVVFASPGGVKAGFDRYEADLRLRALDGITAVEVRSLVFDVWGEPVGYLAVTILDERGAGEDWELHPRWAESIAPAPGLRTSVAWVHRVMLEDESILEADLDAVGLAWSAVTGSPFRGLPEEPPRQAEGS